MFDIMKSMKKLTRTPGGVFEEDGNVPTGRRLDERRWDALNEELAFIGDGDLEVTIVEMKQRMNADHAEWLLRIAEYDRRQLAEVHHRLTTVGWLRSTLRMTGRAASSIVRQGRGLLRMPEVAKAASEGSIPPEVVEMLDRARRRHPAEFPHHEFVFADIATYLDPREMRMAVSHWEQQIDYPSAVARTRAQRQRRRFSINQTWDGMWAVSGELDPETGSIVNSAIRSVAEPTSLDAHDHRQPWQKRADALGDLCEHWLRSGESGSSGGVKPHVTVTVDAQALFGLRQRLAVMDDGVVAPETVQRIACDSTIVRMLLDDSGSPVDVGRATRTIPPGLRRALDARDRGCQWTGCRAPVDWCDAHHIEHWSNGGPTDLANLVLLCRTHHTAIHQSDHPSTSLPSPARPP